MNVAASAPRLLVTCLCAGWCTTCEAYRAVFEQSAREHPQARFAWVDIEDESDALGDAALDIESFPTLLIVRDGAPCFYGTVLPHGATVSRLVEAAQEAGELPALSRDQIDAWALAASVEALSRGPE
ncbi:thioredoxin family protein [Methylibium rhizosphaerae]|uniref:thioredoxin family protein n=1 Tax=Methylibium rhizosphaerae TaxID=2570323 RepID=UPI00112C68F4|nr:thioredoxin family protein [Methylibium rhizosphaerae]